jgi:hypothetical protein
LKRAGNKKSNKVSERSRMTNIIAVSEKRARSMIGGRRM